MRGRETHVLPRYVLRWITPACAGKSGRPVDLSGALRDHPRACGEEAKIFRAECGPTGSPPRVRGRVADQLTSRELLGITPARAGKSLTACGAPSRPGDHPRVCGEEDGDGVGLTLDGGSPPRMRGRAQRMARPGTDRGITPAYAGKSGGGADIEDDDRDHPRVCGEEHFPTAFARQFSGSPPRMRGREDLKQVSRTMRRITPAYAGKRKALPHHEGSY